jgi:uncharacterized SAM-binding protein YcdF (DUF218 family)
MAPAADNLPQQKAITTPQPATRSHGPLHMLGRGLHRLRRTIISVLALAMLAQVLLIATPVTEKLFDWLTVSGPAQPADVILCLGGAHERLLWTADLFRRGLAPRVVVSNAPGAAEEMRRWLELCGVPRSKILLDRGSHVTADHAGSIAHLPGINPQHERFLIVTNQEHSRRVAACFRKGGYTHFTIYGGPPTRSDERGIRWRIVFLPRIAYECAGLLQYWVQGRI